MLSKYFSNPYLNFMPDSKVLNTWSSTSKRSTNSYSVERPGMYNEPSVSHLIGFILIFAVEGFATLLAKEKGALIAVIVSLIAFDVILALGSHYKIGEMALLKNKKVLATGLDAENIKTTISNCRNVTYFFFALILVSSLLKCYFFHSFYKAFNGVKYSVFLGYLIGGALHCICTGYACAYIKFRFQLNRQFNEFKSSNSFLYSFDKSTPIFTKIEAGSAILNEVSTFKHSIIKQDNEFYFTTKGILLDTELSELIARQRNPQAQTVIAREGLQLQINMMSW